jgi:hypothetical protein
MDRRLCGLAQNLVLHSQPLELAMKLPYLGTKLGIYGLELPIIGSAGHDQGPCRTSGAEGEPLQKQNRARGRSASASRRYPIKHANRRTRPGCVQNRADSISAPSAVRQFGSSAVRQFGSSAVRQFGSSAVRQFGIQAPRRRPVFAVPQRPASPTMDTSRRSTRVNPDGSPPDASEAARKRCMFEFLPRGGNPGVDPQASD